MVSTACAKDFCPFLIFEHKSLLTLKNKNVYFITMDVSGAGLLKQDCSAIKVPLKRFVEIDREVRQM